MIVDVKETELAVVKTELTNKTKKIRTKGEIPFLLYAIQ